MKVEFDVEHFVVKGPQLASFIRETADHSTKVFDGKNRTAVIAALAKHIANDISSSGDEATPERVQAYLLELAAEAIFEVGFLKTAVGKN